MSEGTRSKDLQCHWVSIHSLPGNTLKMDFPEFECCDMEGAIRFAKRLMPEVAHIITFSGEKLDTQYLKKEDGTWDARLSPHGPTA